MVSVLNSELWVVEDKKVEVEVEKQVEKKIFYKGEGEEDVFKDVKRLINKSFKEDKDKGEGEGVFYWRDIERSIIKSIEENSLSDAKLKALQDWASNLREDQLTVLWKNLVGWEVDQEVVEKKISDQEEEIVKISDLGGDELNECYVNEDPLSFFSKKCSDQREYDELRAHRKLWRDVHTMMKADVIVKAQLKVLEDWDNDFKSVKKGN